jgi:hypothetical protein
MVADVAGMILFTVFAVTAIVGVSFAVGIEGQ